ncbi:DUF1127 domain-containing protein [Falsiroseomonas sp. HC035]|uniref:DUF1127 domain-containing protein n=1 Tax=Falsiroseomonas sp. HC035 TaxID=3390999 RepID=UPI003D31EED2
MPALSRPAAGLPAGPVRRTDVLAALLDWLAACAHRHRTRIALRDLCPHLLRDLGLTKSQALREARRPFWQR